ncbi:hypothetical protein P43SY_008746 [Pythium insidiosum]|uniref:Transmembrane protein n=1 Tax=Pythium insidiosum TaxID=114742 RepID=A0AAD5LEV6_PYTIN|nr:hypothetical protein P43SY_008746 [Pythium insidiosum]
MAQQPSPRPPPQEDSATLSLQVHDDDREDLSASSRKYHRHPSRRGLCCVRFGRTRVLCSLTQEYGYFPMTAHVGPHWPFMLITYAVALGPLAMIFISGRDIHVGLRIALIVSSVVTTVVFSLVACSDPGVVFRSHEPLAPTTCGDVQTADQSSTVICGKCIGRRTLILFYLFLWAITIHLVIFGVGATITYLKR